MSISAVKVGHVVLRVSELDRALSFYGGVLGFKEVARRDFGEGPMVFLSSGNSHHDLALVEVGTESFHQESQGIKGAPAQRLNGSEWATCAGS